MNNQDELITINIGILKKKKLQTITSFNYSFKELHTVWEQVCVWPMERSACDPTFHSIGESAVRLTTVNMIVNILLLFVLNSTDVERDLKL